MSDWYETRLGDIADICIGGTPSRAEASYWASTGEEGFPWVSISDLKSRIVSNTAESITALGARNSNVKLVPCGTIMMSFKLSLGRIAFAGRDIYTNEAIASFEVDTDKIDKTFLFYQLPEVVKLAITDTAIKGATLNKAKLNELVIPHPELVVQRKIAEILSTIDNQIEATQALIDKYTAIKQGMMADLFSRGIDPETKALRPKFEEAPELYYKTPLGMLPKGWSVVPASTICERVIDCKNRTPPEHNEGFAVIKTSNIKNGELIADSLTFTDEHSYHIWTARGVPQAGDVVITREAPVGESFLITDEMPSMCLGQRTMLYRPDPEAIQPMFMYFATRSPRFLKKLIDMAGGSTVGHVRVGDIKDMIFPKPNLSEQELISQACLAISDKLRTEKEFLEKLISQKSGLMQDLLSGKVPVPA